jgi:hypothetical protein
MINFAIRTYLVGGGRLGCAHFRPHHRPAWVNAEALAYIAAQAGKQFDPHIVKVFLEMIANGAI